MSGANAIRAERLHAQIEGGFVLFLIGMRVNSLWKVHRWWPVAIAMPRMLRELAQRPELGFLGGHTWGGRAPIVVQYWRSLEQLLAYSRERDAAHLPAWREFNRRVGTSGDVGIWHETYVVAPGTYESLYVNMPPFGLGRIGTLRSASGGLQTAAARFRAGGASTAASGAP